MANHTESGAFAVGAPMSEARIRSEAEHALSDLDKLHDVILDTDEGLHLFILWCESSEPYLKQFLEDYLKQVD